MSVCRTELDRMLSYSCGLYLLLKQQVFKLMFIGLELLHACAKGRLVVALGDGVDHVELDVIDSIAITSNSSHEVFFCRYSPLGRRNDEQILNIKKQQNAYIAM
jgi:hypothetical protein